MYVDLFGNIFVAEGQNHRISKCDSAGNTLGWLGGASDGWKITNAPSSNNNYQSFNNPCGVFVDSSGYIFVADRNNHRISKWRN